LTRFWRERAESRFLDFARNDNVGEGIPSGQMAVPT
jgi:hypothetical protein